MRAELNVFPVMQAHAWVALGKICLADETTAKKCVPLFIQELGRSTNPAVRIIPLLRSDQPSLLMATS